jgi:hypothetical protein
LHDTEDTEGPWASESPVPSLQLLVLLSVRLNESQDLSYNPPFAFPPVQLAQHQVL